MDERLRPYEEAVVCRCIASFSVQSDKRHDKLNLRQPYSDKGCDTIEVCLLEEGDLRRSYKPQTLAERTPIHNRVRLV